MSKSGEYNVQKGPAANAQSPELRRAIYQRQEGSSPSRLSVHLPAPPGETSTEDADPDFLQPETLDSTRQSAPLFTRNKSRTLPPTFPQTRPQSESQEHHNYDAYFIYSEKDADKARRIMNDVESKRLRCCSFRRDCLPNETIFTQFSAFLFESRRVVVLMSPNFFDRNDNLNTFQWQTAVSYCMTHNLCSIVSLLIEDCDQEIALESFPAIDGARPDWLSELLSEIRRPASPWKRPDQKESYRSLQASMRSVVSEPATLRIKISDEVKTKIKIWRRYHSMLETQGKRTTDFSAIPASPSLPALHEKTRKEESPHPSTDGETGTAMSTTCAGPHPSPVSGTHSVEDRSCDTRMLGNMSFLLDLRRRGLKTVEANKSHFLKKEDDLKVEDGDVLQLLGDDEGARDLEADAGPPSDLQSELSTPGAAASVSQQPAPSNRSLVRNYLDKIGYVPTSILGPCVSIFPSQALKKLKMAPTEQECQQFKEQVLSLGGELGCVKEDVDSKDYMSVSVRKGECVQIRSKSKCKTEVRTVRNEVGYMPTRALEDALTTSTST